MASTAGGIGSRDLAEIKQDLIAFNAQVERIKKANQFGKLGLAEAALTQAAGLFVTHFEFMRTLEQRLERVENAKK